MKNICHTGGSHLKLNFTADGPGLASRETAYPRREESDPSRCCKRRSVNAPGPAESEIFKEKEMIKTKKHAWLLIDKKTNEVASWYGWKDSYLIKFYKTREAARKEGGTLWKVIKIKGFKI